MRKIVLTGGAGSGKTVVTRALAASEPHRFAIVPEAATQVYAILHTRWDRLDVAGRRDVQRRIYQLQREQEDRIAASHPSHILLLDRGTIDGAAYWPEGPHDYWRDLGTTPAVELARYDRVICLQSAAAIGAYDGDASNACRFEDAAAAIAGGELLASIWAGHPDLHHVPACGRIEEKVACVREIIERVSASVR